MSYLRVAVQNFVCVLIAGVLAYGFSTAIGDFYCMRIESCSPGLASVDFSELVGMIIGYFFFIPFLLTVFGLKGKFWLTAILTLPVLVLAIYFGIRLMQLMPMVLSIIVGMITGALANKTLAKFAPGFMAKIQ